MHQRDTKTSKKGGQTPDFGKSLFDWEWHSMIHPQLKIQRIWSNFGQFWIFFVKNRFLPSTRSAPPATLKMGKSISQKLRIFGFFMTKYTCLATAKTFHQVLSPQKVKKHAKNDLLPLFGHTGSSLGRLHFWRGKWAPNWEIPLGLESRHPALSNKPTLASFGCREVPQKWAQRCATRREMARYASGKLWLCRVLGWGRVWVFLSRVWD